MGGALDRALGEVERQPAGASAVRRLFFFFFFFFFFV